MTYDRHSFDWTDERCEQLRTLWADNSLSAAKIGAVIGGVSRMAVIGKARRMGLPAREIGKRYGSTPRIGLRRAKPSPSRPKLHQRRHAARAGPLSDAALAAIVARLERGPTTAGVTMSPWAEQLVRDTYALLREVERVRAPAQSEAA